MNSPSVPRSLGYATDLDVLPPDRRVDQRDGYLVVRSPGNPHHYWGNFLLFADAPEPGDGERWETLFAAEFGDDPRVRHRAFGWDQTDGILGGAEEEFVARGYDLDASVTLLADADSIGAHPRENRDVIVRALDPTPGADSDLWAAVVELQVASRDEGHEEEQHRVFTVARLEARKELFRAGRGAWYVALDPATDELAASCGIVVTAGRARYQVVDTALAYRRRGICSRLVVEAARHAAETYGATQFVIVAEAGYHALGLYESLGFEPRERYFGVCLWERSGG